MKRYVHLTPRLEVVPDMVGRVNSVADIGCDHGRLSAALLQRGCAEHIHACDISAESLQKARDLLEYIGQKDHVSFYCGDGLSALPVGAFDGVLLLGMGGTLMTRILDAVEQPLHGARFGIFQPMRAQSDIREYLYQHCYHITDDRIVAEQGRLYQVFRAEPRDCRQRIPEDFPFDFLDVGFIAYAEREENFFRLCRQQYAQHLLRLPQAKGTAGEEKLLRKIRALKQLLEKEDAR